MLMLLLMMALVAPPAQDSLLVTAQWLRANIGRPDVVVVHAAMGRGEYDQGHVPGARFADVMSFHGHQRADRLLPVEQLVAAVQAAGISNQDRVVLVGSPMNTALVFVALDYIGHGHRTSVLDGGLPAWRTSGGKVSTAAAPATAGRFQPNVRADMVVTADWIAARLESPGLALLDARTGAEFDGVSDIGELPRPGHIPSARLLDWMDTLAGVPAATGAAASDDPGARLQPRSELERLFREAGVDGRREIVTYCTIGMRASHLYFVARLLGYQPKLYVGSMADWSHREELPVVGPRR
jgi:thiosulfate/3-mercaptopyruvate sulfurtransferase